jgi:hypothetical protein
MQLHRGTEMAEAPSSSLCRCAAASASVGLVYYKQGLSVAAKGKSRWERDAETASCSR